jgi:signal recognition particle subunit SRP54
VIDPSRRNRIASGSGTQPQDVNQLVKQYEFVAPMMKAMAGKGMLGRMQALRELQQSGALDPANAGRLNRIKGTTGKRLSSKEKADMRKQREREMRRRKRDQRRPH